MILTTEEAGKKLCPMKFTKIGYLEGRGRAGKEFPDTIMNRTPVDTQLCSADRCMAWLWENFATKMGYCGMAGEPIGIPHDSD